MIEPKAEKLIQFEGTFSIENPSADSLVKLTFKDQARASAFYDAVVKLMPFINMEYPKLVEKVILLTQEQYFFYKRCAIAETGKLTTAYLGESFLKTLRSDEFDFSLAFILGIIPAPQNRRHLQNLRPKNREPVTITPQGNIVLRQEKQSTHTSKEKEGFSQIQSCTHIDEEARSAAFGHRKDRQLFGIITHIDDTLISRMLINDFGTVSRLFDFSDIESATTSSSHQKYSNGSIFPPSLFKSFKENNLKFRQNYGGTNEVLARLRFNPYRSIIAINTDTLEARLLANYFAQELLQYFAVYAESQGMILNPHYKIPIIFYVPKNSHGFRNSTMSPIHELKFYTSVMLQKDRIESASIFKNTTLRMDYYRNQKYEFLLGLGVITAEILLEPVDTIPLALAMIKNSKVRMLTRLLGIKTQSNLSDQVFDALLTKGMIAQNDPIIATLIMAEAFEIADKIIRATKSVKTKLTLENRSLIDHIVSYGNPRHFNFMGLNQMLIHAAKMRSWFSITLCLKEFSHMAHTFPREIITEAIKSKEDEAIILLNKYYPKSEISTDFGYLLLNALQDQELKSAKFLLQAGAKANWRNQQTEIKYQLLSTLYYAVKFGFNELLPGLIEHEKECQNEFYQARLTLALDLAHCLKNYEAVTLFSTICKPALIDPDNIHSSICKLILEALVIRDSQFAELRLIRYCQEYNLLPNNNSNVLDGMEILQDYFPPITDKEEKIALAKTITQEFRNLLFDNEVDFDKFISLPNESSSFSKSLIDIHYQKADILYKATIRTGDVIFEFDTLIKMKQWKTLKLFTRYKTDAEGKVAYGYVLLKALEYQKTELAKLSLKSGAKANWRNQKTKHKYQLLSTLYYAVKFGFNELLPELIEHEKECQNEFYQARIRLALDLAYCVKNHVAITLLSTICTPALIDPDNIHSSICKLVLEALAIRDREITELRLIQYCREYNLLPNNNSNILDGMEILQDHFPPIVDKQARFILTKIITQQYRRPPVKNDDDCYEFIFISDVSASLIENLLNEQYQKADLLYKLTMTPKDVRKELHKLIKKNNWKTLELFTRYKADPEDKVAYGYVLLKALENQQPELAKLYLKAGAKATWRNWMENDGHPLMSALLHAVNHDYHDLLPQLIELEKNTPDDRTQAKLSLALDLAYVRGNQEAITLIEQNNDTTSTIDSTNIAKSICAQVFEAFSAGYRKVGELRLLRYCHAHALMSKENLRVIDGLNRLKIHFLDALKLHSQNDIIRILTILFEILISDLDPELLRSSLDLLEYDYDDDSQEPLKKEMYRVIMKNLTSDNFDMVNEIICHHESIRNTSFKLFWTEVIQEEFSKKVSESKFRQTPDPVATLLFKLVKQLSSHAYFEAFECAIATNNVELSILLINHPLCGDKVKERSLIDAMKQHNTHLILSLISNTKFTVTLDLISAAIKNDLFLVLLSLLKNSEIQKDTNKIVNWTLYSNLSYTSPKDHHWTLYSIWAYCTLTEDKRRASCKLLTRIFGASKVMHFTIVNALIILSSKYITSDSPSIWPRLDQVLARVSSQVLSFTAFEKKHQFKYDPKDSDTHKKILTLLNEYFSHADPMPTEAVIIRTFKIMQEHFKLLYDNSFPNKFFKIKPLTHRDYNTEIYNTLRDVDEAIKNSNTPDLEPIDESIDDKMVYTRQ